MIDYYVYVNNYWFDNLEDSNHYNERPEPYRGHEKKLWTLFQIIKSGNSITITNKEKQEVCILKGEVEYKKWILEKYPKFLYQLDKEIYTKYLHPDDTLKLS